MNSPRISVLMPVYKPQSRHLKEAIDSVLTQTFSDLELIIIDDCPADVSAEDVIKSYCDKRIKYFRNEKNLGIAKTRNRLLEIAFESQSEYIAIVDHDDIQLQSKYEKMIKFLDENPTIGVVGAGFYEWWEKTGEIKTKFLPEFDFLIRLNIFIGKSGIIHASMVRKELFKKHNIRYLDKYSEPSDQMMWMDMLRHTSFYNIQEPLTKYRWHDTNTSLLLKHREKEFMQSILDYIKEKYSKESIAAKSMLNELSENKVKKYKKLFYISLFISIVLVLVFILSYIF